MVDETQGVRDIFEEADINAHMDYPMLVFRQIDRIMIYRSSNESQFIAAVIALDKLVVHYQDTTFKDAIKELDKEFIENQGKIIPAQKNEQEHKDAMYFLTIDYYDKKFGEIMALVGRRSLTPGMTQSKIDHLPRG